MSESNTPAWSPGVVRNLYCSCCSEHAGRFAQHWNQDTGYGICRPCVLRHYLGKSHTIADIEQGFGKEGVSWANAEQWAALEAKRAERWDAFVTMNTTPPNGGAQ